MSQTMIPLILLLSIRSLHSAAPTSPDQADAGSIPVTAPINVRSTALKLSPEQLVVASMPWEGMDQPEAQRRAIFPRQDPWDTAPDSTLHRPFGHYAAIPARPPPFIPGDVDTNNEAQGKAREAEEWMRQSIVPSLPAVGPAFYGRDSKPENYYLNPLTKHSPFAVATSAIASSMSLLESSKTKNRLRHMNTNTDHPSPRSTTVSSLLEIKGTGNTYWNQLHASSAASNLQRMQAVGVTLQSKLKLKAPNDLGGFSGGEASFKASKFSIPPVAANLGLGGTPPQLAVLGDQKEDMTVAPRVQQFTGSMNWQKDMKDGKPLPVRPYAQDHPAAYQQQPLWPPAPPEPLFPLKMQDERR